MSSVTPDVAQPAAGARARRINWRGETGLLASRLALIVLCLIVLLPAFWVVTASVQPGSSAFSSTLFPTAWSLVNYRTIIDDGFFIWLQNSLIICIVAGALGLTFNTLGAYAFSRLRFPGRRYGLIGLLVLQTFPAVMAIPAIYTLLIKLNLLDTLYGLILVYLGASAFNMWLIKNYMDTIPRELDEAAYVDGASAVRIFWQILLPLMRPMLVTVFIWTFSAAYSDFIMASFVLQSADHYTVMVGLYHLISDQYAAKWAQFAAGAVLASLPICVIYLGLQKQLTAGLAQGAVKG